MPKAKDIVGFMVDKKEEAAIDQFEGGEIVGFNQAIDLQGERYLEIEWDREKLAEIIFNRSMHVGTWEDLKKTKGINDNGCYKLADAIIASKDVARIVCKEEK